MFGAWPTTRWMLSTWPRLARMRSNISASMGSSGCSGAPPRREIGREIGLSAMALIQFRHREILPARHVGDIIERLAERPRRIDADARGDAHGPVLAQIDRRIGRTGRRVLDHDHVTLR